MLPSIVLGLFCGLRTEELKRLDWKNVHLDGEKPYVSIGSEIAKKRRKRNVRLIERYSPAESSITSMRRSILNRANSAFDVGRLRA